MVATVRSLNAPTSPRPGSVGCPDDLAPGKNGVAGEERRDMPAAVDRRDMESVGEAVEAQGASERNDVAAIDQAAPETPLPLGELVEMHLGGILIEPGRGLVLSLLDRDPVDMIDPFARE